MMTERFSDVMVPKCPHCGHAAGAHDTHGCTIVSPPNPITGPFDPQECTCQLADGVEPWAPTPGEPYRLSSVMPLRDRYLIAPLAVSSRTKGGLHLPGTSHERDRPLQGIVLGHGLGAWNPNRTARVPLEAEVGDLVSFGKYSGQEVELAGQTVLNMAENEIYAVVKHGHFVLVEHDDARLNHLQGDYCDICASPEEKAAKLELQAERERLLQAQVDQARRELNVPASVPELVGASMPVEDPEVEKEAKSALQIERERLAARRRAAEALERPDPRD